MDADKLRELLQSGETPRVEFKLKYDFSSPNKTGLRDEIAKDLLALVNTAGRHAEDYSYLVLGIGDRPKPDGTKDVEDVSPLNYSSTVFLNLVNARCYPSLPGLSYEIVEADGNHFGVITIPPSNYTHALARDLVTDKGKLWRKDSVLVRHGDEVAVAGPDEIELMKAQKEWKPGPAALAQVTVAELKLQIRDLLSREVAYVDQECARSSDKPIISIFVNRSFETWTTTHRQVDDLRVRRVERNNKPWQDVVESIRIANAAILIGDPGSGKTLLLLNEVQNRCNQALLRLDQEDSPDDLEFAVYFHANALASRLTSTQKHPIQVMLDILTERHHIVSEYLSAWLQHKLDRRQILIAIDALDEVSQESLLILTEGVSGLARGFMPCPMLLSARRVGYVSSPIPFAAQWELLPFTQRQLTSAVGKWFVGDATSLQNIKNLIQQTPPLEELLLNPLFCMLACKVWDESVEQDGQGTPTLTFTNRCDLYLSFCYRFRARWIERVERAEKKQLSRIEKDAFLPFVEHLAWVLWSRDPRRTTFTGMEISQAIAEMRPPELSGRVDLLRDICEAGIMTKASPEGVDSTYLFLHRTILEFFAASYVARTATGPIDNAGAERFTPYVTNPATRGILWMLTGRLKNPMPVIDEILSWATMSLESSHTVSVDTQAPAIARLLVECLFEIRNGSVDTDAREQAWALATRGLDRLQRRKRKEQWKSLADLDLTFRTLYAVNNHEGRLSRSEPIRKLLLEIRSGEVRHEKGGILPENALQDVHVRLRQGYASTCPVVRWISIWITGLLHGKGQTKMQTQFGDRLIEVLTNDESVYVRSIACRCIAELKHPKAFEVLRPMLNGEDLPLAAAAAIGLEHLMTDDAIAVLMAKAEAVLDSPTTDLRSPLPVALIGALEGVVSSNEQHYARNPDKRLIDIFLRALDYRLPLTRSSAASALGKMGWTEAWEPLKSLVQHLGEESDDIRMMRGSAAFACSRLCNNISESDFAEVSRFLQGRLRDIDEIQEVRRPAAFGLQTLVRRGHVSESLRHDLLAGAQDQDLIVSERCLITLMHLPEEMVSEDISILVEDFDRQGRIEFCGAVKKDPTRIGMSMLDWLLQNDGHSDVVVKALYAVGHVCEKASEFRERTLPAFVDDTELLTNLVKHCLVLLTHKMPEIVINSLPALQHLCRLLYKAKKLDRAILESVRGQARALLSSADERILAGTASLLSIVGDQSDIAPLRKVREFSQSTKLRHNASWAIDRLSERYLYLRDR